MVNDATSSEVETSSTLESSSNPEESSAPENSSGTENPVEPETPVKDYSYRPQITEVMPAIRINTEDGSNEFATKYTQQDKTQDKIEYVGATISVDGCEEKYEMSDVEAEVKVRGNFTLNYDKKPLRIKFKKKNNILGLHDGAKYKNWVLLADWRDLGMSNNATAFYLGNTILGSDGYYCSDYRNVEVYLNGEYWGVYLLVEQQEAKEGRASVSEVEDDYTGTDIGYFFEYDGYYTQEEQMPNGAGDPTFTINYYTAQNGAAPFDFGEDFPFPDDGTGGGGFTPPEGGDNGGGFPGGDNGGGFPGGDNGGGNFGGLSGPTNGYTVKSDIYSDEQLAFIQFYTEKVYEIAVRATNNEFYAFNEDYSAIVAAEGSMKEVVGAVIDLQSLVDMYILHEICCDPDIAWSSFYMSVDMSAAGNKKLTFEAPWDFDAGLGIKADCMASGEGLFAATSENPWLTLFVEQDWFQEMVKAKWQEMKENGVQETALELIMEQKETYVAYYAKNYERWPQRLTEKEVDQTEILKQATTQAEAADHLYNWLQTRFNYLDTQWGNK